MNTALIRDHMVVITLLLCAQSSMQNLIEDHGDDDDDDDADADDDYGLDFMTNSSGGEIERTANPIKLTDSV